MRSSRLMTTSLARSSSSRRRTDAATTVARSVTPRARWCKLDSGSGGACSGSRGARGSARAPLLRRHIASRLPSDSPGVPFTVNPLAAPSARLPSAAADLPSSCTGTLDCASGSAASAAATSGGAKIRQKRHLPPKSSHFCAICRGRGVFHDFHDGFPQRKKLRLRRTLSKLKRERIMVSKTNSTTSPKR